MLVRCGLRIESFRVGWMDVRDGQQTPVHVADQIAILVPVAALDGGMVSVLDAYWKSVRQLRGIEQQPSL